MLQTFLAVLHFDGGRFVGWQRQPSGRSVQAEVEKALEQLAGQPVEAHASGRTDAGVHSIGLGVSTTLSSGWTPDALRRALNALLPSDCWVESVARMQPGFHARKSASFRRYRYDIGTDDASRSPFRRRFEWALARPLDLDLLRAATEPIRGEHQFEAFAAKGVPKRHYRCRIHLAEWEPRAGERGVRLHIEADRFLHHMVRMLVGTMADVGRGRRPPNDMAALLERHDNLDTSPPAPPEGLYFAAATYPAEWYAEPQELGAEARRVVRSA
ncbi:MAG TPA: tRNA pseudouridine(38-40) synthase TruA [Gemmatimonadales bacterium]|nr:tRNA pseudouridine(38-40) synthase TruA [Gemmatimonadales bacterium]